MEPSTLPQRGEGAEAAEIESILCPSAPLRQTEHPKAGYTRNEFYKSLYARDEAQ
jgi:hypothetical protein